MMGRKTRFMQNVTTVFSRCVRNYYVLHPLVTDLLINSPCVRLKFKFGFEGGSLVFFGVVQEN